MPSSNKRAKKLARDLQAKTGLRYTEALARVRLSTTKEDAVTTIDPESPLMKALAKAKKSAEERVEIRKALEQKVEEIVKELLQILRDIPVVVGERSIGEFSSPGPDDSSGSLFVGLSSYLPYTSNVKYEAPVEFMQLAISTAASKLCLLRIGGSIAHPEGWTFRSEEVPSDVLQEMVDIYSVMTSKPEVLEEKASEQDIPADLSGLLRKRRSSGRQRLPFSSVDSLGLIVIPARQTASIEGAVKEDCHWNGKLLLESSEESGMNVEYIDVGASRTNLPWGTPISAFREDSEFSISLRRRTLEAGTKIKICIKNDTDEDRAVNSSISYLPVAVPSLEFKANSEFE